MDVRVYITVLFSLDLAETLENRTVSEIPPESVVSHPQ